MLPVETATLKINLLVFKLSKISPTKIPLGLSFWSLIGNKSSFIHKIHR